MSTIQRGITAMEIVRMLDKYERITEKLSILVLARALVIEEYKNKTDQCEVNDER